MRPAGRVYAARVIINIYSLIVVFLLLKLQFYVVLKHFLRPFVARRDIFASLCGPQALFSLKMWPASILKFETPALA